MRRNERKKMVHSIEILLAHHIKYINTIKELFVTIGIRNFELVTLLCCGLEMKVIKYETRFKNKNNQEQKKLKEKIY